ncbi:hypothetical protein AKJ65_07145 [candidate division MSBL1 archaeon SCGC-AAA259E19]|uniref:Uncharacterized protein n=1 Tax=candidate division MSBL1 archaeon SCGC-AAA259E19 TaxID=1698264 RepID=A0A133UF37_9EURY|nr:hypothetical protein AKJ65_07145 [candidate division MSBL1 archaeon SCGC-AAA259E19]
MESDQDIISLFFSLEGVVSGLDSDRELTLPRKIAEGKYTEKKLEEIKEQMKRRASQEFRRRGRGASTRPGPTSSRPMSRRKRNPNRQTPSVH